MCCKKIKDILFPLNVLGKKKQCVNYQLTDPLPNTIPVEWIGERLRITFTYYKRIYHPMPKKVTIPEIVDLENGDGSEEIIGVHRNGFAIADDWTIHFNCTNVTSLIVNGETLI